MFTAARTMFVGLVVAAVLVLGVASAGAAANLVQNPSFTDDCSGVPCHWTAVVQGETISRDTVNFHTAPASLASSVPAEPFSTGGEIHSDCFAVSPSTTYNFAGFYRTTASATSSVVLALIEFSDGACGSLVDVGLASASPPVTTGAWTFLNGQTTTPASAKSAYLALQHNCNAATCPAMTANFDDVGVSTGPLAVTVVSFTAHRAGKGVLLRWRTGTEANELGFNVYRQQGARRVLVNRRLLPALGAIAGSSYSYRDRRAPKHRALRYWLQAVAVDGTRTRHGPVRASGA
jgi:hypothetical protein